MKTYKATAIDLECIMPSNAVFFPYVASVTCDVCGKTYNVDEDIFEFQEIICLDFYGGYDSVFGDMSHCTLDICQHCLKSKLGKWIKQKQY